MNLVRQVGVWATVCVGNARRNALWVGGSRLSGVFLVRWRFQTGWSGSEEADPRSFGLCG